MRRDTARRYGRYIVRRHGERCSIRSISSGRLNGFGRIADTPSLQDGLRIDVQVRGDDDDRDRAEVAGLLEALQEIPAVDVRAWPGRAG